MIPPRVCFPLLCIATGCAASRSFVPVEYATALSPDGEHGAAEYELYAKQQELGILQIWFQGVSQEELSGHPESRLHLGFMLVNLGPDPIEFDPKSVFLEDVRLASGVLRRIPPSAVEGNTRVAPSYRQEIDVSFALPSETKSDDVEAFRVAWGLHDGTTYAAQTHFIPEQPRRVPRLHETYYGYCWIYPSPYYAWPYYDFGWTHSGYGWPYYCGTPGGLDWIPPYGWGYWFAPLPGPLPPSYMRSRHR